MQTDATWLANNSCHCWMLHVTFVCTSCCILLEDVAHLILNRSNFWSQQLPKTSIYRQRVAQQCWIPVHSSSNTVEATHAHCTCFTKSYELYPSHDALLVRTLLELLHPFAHHCHHERNNSQHCWPNNDGSYSVCLHFRQGFFPLPARGSWVGTPEAPRQKPSWSE